MPLRIGEYFQGYLLVTAFSFKNLWKYDHKGNLSHLNPEMSKIPGSFVDYVDNNEFFANILPHVRNSDSARPSQPTTPDIRSGYSRLAD